MDLFFLLSSSFPPFCIGASAGFEKLFVMMVGYLSLFVHFFREGGRQVLDDNDWIFFFSFILVWVGGGQFLESVSWLYCFVVLSFWSLRGREGGIWTKCFVCFYNRRWGWTIDD